MLCRLLGIPEEDAGQMVAWGDQMISNADPEYTPVIIDKVDTEEYRLLPFRSPAALEVYRYAEEIALERRRVPRDDIITTLLTAEPDGEPLSDLEFKNFFTLLMVAGNETTRHTISHGLIFLDQNPDQLAWWREDVAGRSVDATEEILRASAVTMHFRRTVTEDTAVRGVPMTAGDRVVMWYTSANYDDDVFADPYELDLSRKPNAHLTFGTGRHKCLGASLAQLEVRVFFEEFLERTTGFEVGQPDLLRSNFIRGIKHLPVLVSS
jgi:cytochrome P450